MAQLRVAVLTHFSDQVVEDNLDSLAMDLQLPETLDLRPLQGEELLCSKYLTDIKLKLHQPVETLVVDPAPVLATQDVLPGQDRKQTPQKAGARPQEEDHVGKDPPQAGPRKRTPKSPAPVALTGPDSVPSEGGGLLRHSQLGPDTRPPIRQSGDQFIRNPDERPIKPAARTGADPFQ